MIKYFGGYLHKPHSKFLEHQGNLYSKKKNQNKNISSFKHIDSLQF